jgi:hypothetical protein
VRGLKALEEAKITGNLEEFGIRLQGTTVH